MDDADLDHHHNQRSPKTWWILCHRDLPADPPNRICHLVESYGKAISFSDDLHNTTRHRDFLMLPIISAPYSVLGALSTAAPTLAPALFLLLLSFYL